MAEFIKDLTWTRRTFPPRGARGMPSTLDEIVSPTVDVLGSLRLEEVQYRLTLGTLGLTSVEGEVVGSTDVWLVLGTDLSHDDPTNRALKIMILNKTGTLTVGLPADFSPDIGIAASRRVSSTLGRLYLAPGERLRGESNFMVAGQRLFLRYRFIVLPLGEVVRL